MLAAAALAAWAVYSRVGPATDAPARAIVLVTIDTLRADRLHGGAMPALDRFAQGGRRFSHARTTAPLTLPAHASMLTGLLPPAHGARENGEAASGRGVASILRASGYRTGAFVSAFVLDRQFGLAEGFETYDDRVMRDPAAALRLEAERPGAQTIDAALAWLATIDAPRERFFLWVHLFEPHAPYDPPAGCGAERERDGDGGARAYDRDVACADVLAARLIERVTDAAGPDVAWIVAGDHGEALGEHGEQTHGMLAYDATLRVPLFLHGPGVAAGSSDAPVSVADIAPTLLRWAGVAPPPEMEGVDLRGTLPSDRDVYSETRYPRAAGWHDLSALSGRRWKTIRSSVTELYDLAADAGESRDVSASHKQIAGAMAAAAGAIASRATAPRQAPSAEAQERLRALGYVGGGAASQPAGERAPNPASVIDDWVMFEQALTALHTGRAREVLVMLTTLAGRHPEGRVFQSTLARALEDAGNPRAALAVHRRIVERWPDDAMLFHDLAAAARAAGDASEAVRAEQAALALDPSNAAALNGLGLTHADAGRSAEAAAAFERAAARDPGNASYWTNLGNARRELGDTAAAERAYRRAVDVNPAYADGLNGLGVILVQTQRAAGAVTLFERAIAADPAHADARLNLGIALQESGRLDDARRAYRDVLARTAPGSREHEAATALLTALK